METPVIFIPMDRRQAMAQAGERAPRQTLPDRSEGTTLFADISGFTPLTEALVRLHGVKKGAEELTIKLNAVYDALISEVDRYGGSVLGFAGDAITCWFDGASTPGLSEGQSSMASAARRAICCGLAMQRAMQRFHAITLAPEVVVTLAMKVAIASGPARRFLVGDPEVQLIDVLAGATLERMASAEHQANKGEVVLSAETVAMLEGELEVVEWRVDEESGDRFGVIAGLETVTEPTPWPSLPDDALTDDQIRPWLHRPVYDRLQSGATSEYLSELRPAVALFMRFGGIDYDGDAEAGRKLDRYIQWVQRILETQGGFLIQLTIGDKGSYLYAAFGAPLNYEDIEARAVAVALSLLKPPADLWFITPPQIGITTGRMRIGPYGGPTRRTYGVLGDEVNLAARLMQRATPGQIIASERIATSTQGRYDFDSLGQITVKGKTAPISVYQVHRQRQESPQRPAQHYPYGLVGRESELAFLDHQLLMALQGTGQIVVVEGNAGIGKSRLTAEFVELAIKREMQVALGTSQSTTQQISYSPWRQLFQVLLGLPRELIDDDASEATIQDHLEWLDSYMAALNPNWGVRLPLLGDLLRLPIPDNPTTAAFDAKTRKEALSVLVIEIIQTLCRDEPTLLILEDAHWMDEASRELTIAVGRAIGKFPVVLCLVQRPAVGEELFNELRRLPWYITLPLRELTPEGAQKLIATRLEAPATYLAMSLIFAATQGNPFFIEELCDNVQEAGNLVQDDGTRWQLSEEIFNALLTSGSLERPHGFWQLAENASLSTVDLGLPDSIQGVVLSRVDRLPEHHKLTLKVASVLGRIFSLEVLAQTHPNRPDPKLLQPQIELLESKDFTRIEMDDGGVNYMFKHNVTHEVTYETLLDMQRRDLHRTAGEVLEVEQPEAVEQLAYHFSRSGVVDKTVLYLDKAARKLQREGANETALSYYTQALALEPRWEWRKEQVEVLHVLGRREAEAEVLALLDADPTAPRTEVTYLRGQYYESIGDYAAAQEMMLAALDVAKSTPSPLDDARCLTQLGLVARRQGDYDRAREWYTQALGCLSGDATDEESLRALARALSGLGTVQRQQGQLDPAIASYNRALHLSQITKDRMGEARALNDLGVTAYYQRDFETAQGHHQKALGIRRAIGDRAGEGASLTNLAAVIRDAGDYGKAQEHMLAALEIQQLTGNRWDEVNVLNELGILYTELGDGNRAQAYLRRGLQITQEIGDEAGRAYLLANLGPLVRDQGDLSTADTLLREGAAIAESQADTYMLSYFLSHHAIAALMAGDAAQAHSMAERALRMREEIDLILWTTADLATLAQAELALDQRERARALAERALTMLDECQGNGPEAPHRDYFICAQVLMALGERSRSIEALQAAHRLIMARAEKINDQSLRSSFLLNVPMNRQIMDALMMAM